MELRKVATLVSLPRLTMVETFGCWHIFCVLIDNSTLLNRHFEIVEPYRPLLASFPFLCPTWKDGGAYCFLPLSVCPFVCLSAQI